jgi:XTP/dITP diphosphohydrolase
LGFIKTTFQYLIMKIIFATNNSHKIKEIRHVLPPELTITGLEEAGIFVDIPEPYETLEENARVKADTIFSISGENCFSEDTGLEVEALNGAPGVKTARYGGEERSFEKNISKLLAELKGKPNRKARFRTVICLLLQGKEYFFEGVCEGEIAVEEKGTDGFGYDPVFIPSGTENTFAEMTLAEKNQYSHRRKAVDKLVVFLKQLDLN